MTNSSITSRADHSSRHRSIVKDQLIASADGAYAFNAEMAKFDVIWVWIVKLPAIGTSLAAVFSLLMGIVLVLNGDDVEFGTREIDPIPYTAWPLWFGAAFGFAVLAVFFWFMTKAMEHRHKIMLEMARQYHEAKN